MRICGCSISAGNRWWGLRTFSFNECQKLKTSEEGNQHLNGTLIQTSLLIRANWNNSFHHNPFVSVHKSCKHWLTLFSEVCTQQKCVCMRATEVFVRDERGACLSFNEVILDIGLRYKHDSLTSLIYLALSVRNSYPSFKSAIILISRSRIITTQAVKSLSQEQEMASNAS